jgi:hypothetical protein
MITLDVILLLVGFFVKIAILTTVAIILFVVGLILLVLVMAGREIGGRRHYY